MKRSIFAVSALTTILAGSAAFAAPQNDDNQMANVQAIMKRAHQQEQQKRDLQKLQEQNQAEAEKAGASFMQSIIKSSKNNARQQFVSQGANPAMSSAAVTSVNSTGATPQVAQLESQLSHLNKVSAAFQKQTQQRIDVLNQEQSTLQNKLSQLNQVLGILNQEVNQLSQQITNAQKQLSTNLTPAQQAKLQSFASGGVEKVLESSKAAHYVLYAILILLLIVIMMLIPRRGGYKIQAVAAGSANNSAANEDAEDTKDEYDFMNSNEAIPAKLDLARAYMAMEDYKSARKVLDQVQRDGNDEQKAEAKKMFEKIPKK